MKRRKFIIGTGALAAGSAAAVGSGAFTSVEANRTVDVSVAGDQSALLRLAPCDGPNGEYATGDGVGGTGPGGISDDYQFELNVPNLNGNAFTRIDEVFEVTNQGTQPVVVYIQEFGPNTVEVDVGVRADQLVTGPFDEGDTGEGIDGNNVFDVSSPSDPGFGNIGIKLDEGQTVKLGIYADTSNGNVNDGVGESGDDPTTGDVPLWNELKIFAKAGEDHAYEADS